MKPFKRMKAKEFRAALAALDLSQLAAARITGADPRTLRRWALDENDAPQPVAMILRYCVNANVTPEAFYEKANK